MDVRRLAGALTVLALAGCTADPGPDPTPPAPTVAPGPFTLDGAPLTDPTGLRLTFTHAYVDLDSGRTVPLPVTGWLARPGQPPLLIEERRTAADFGRARVTAEPSSVLPGEPTVVRLTMPALAVPATAGDARGIWLAEYRDRTGCTLRDVGLDGRDRRPARPVACGTKPIAETPHGLWVDIGPDAFVEATVGSSAADHRMALLDPNTLAEKATFPRVEPIDEDRVLVLAADRWQLHNLRTGLVTPLTRPDARGWVEPRVGPISPDGRHLPLTFGDPSASPQVMDLWLLDLSRFAFTRLPLMPAYTSLKGTDVGWDTDGRLVLVGQFPERGLIATWRPGDAGYLVRPFDRPETPAGAPVDTRFLVY